MREIKETTYRGTRILLGNGKRDLINLMINRLRNLDFNEISIPIIQLENTFYFKVGEENTNLMFRFEDRGGRELCLAPEYTAVMQDLAKTYFKHERDISLFYVQECFRGEKPQAGRYRQFTQIGVEILNPTNSESLLHILSELAMRLVHSVMPDTITISDFNLNQNVARGLDYYKDGKGFEITCNKLGAQKQVCGGGEYDGGVGFAIGIDRLLLLNEIAKD